MEAPMVYPTDAPTAQTGTGQNVESSGKPKSVLNKVKRKVRKLKDKIKKVTGSNTASTEHGDNNEHDKRDFNDVNVSDGEEVDDGAESYEDDDEEDDRISNNQSKYEQLRSIGALDKQGDGSEVEVHGGFPVSTLAASPGTYWKSADDGAPISPYKSAGPPDALQATPTEYRNYAADDDRLLVRGEEKSTTNGLVEDIISRGPDKEINPLGSPSLLEAKMSNPSSYYEPAESHSKHDVSDTASAAHIDVPYPEDLVKPNPSFGKSSSPTHDKIAVMNEDLSADRKLGVGLSSEEHSGSGKGNLLETSVPEFEELIGYQGSPSGPIEAIEADNLVYRPVSDPEVGSSLTPLPGTLDGVVYEPNAIAHSSGTGQCLDNTTSQFQDLSEKAVELPRSGVDKMPSKGESAISPAGAHANETGYTSSYGEQKPIFSTARDGALALEEPADGGIATARDGEHESWGKWSADKINNAKDAGLIGADHTDESKTQANSTDGWGTNLNNAVDVEGDADKVHNLQDDDASKPGVLEDVNKDAEEEFYDPNEVKDNQFQEGFALGSGEEDALSGTLTGSAIEKLQGLKGTVASTLGYSNHDENATGGEQRPGFGEERALSPSHQQQKGGFVQGLKETVTSSLGYGKAASDEASDNNDVSERGEKSEIDVDNRQQQAGGTLQGLKNVVAAKLGYGMAEESPVLTKETESREFPAEASSHEPLYDEGGEHGNGIKSGQVLSDVGDNAHREDEVSRQQQSGGVLQGVKDMVISKLGYDSQPEGFEGEERALSPSHQQQKGGFVQGLKETVTSSLGYGKAASDEASDNNDVSEREEKSEIDVDNRQQQAGGTLQGLKNVVAAKLGYGMSEESPVLTKETESREFPAEASSHEPLYDEGGEHGNGIKAGQVLSDVGDNAHREVSRQQQSGGVLQGVKDMVISKLGYESQPEETSRDTSHTESASVPSGDHQPNSYMQKLFNTTAAAREFVSSKVGYGNSNEDKEERNFAYKDGEKFNISPSTHVGNNIDDYNAMFSIASKVSPSEDKGAHHGESV